MLVSSDNLKDSEKRTRLVRGFIFACTQKSEAECLQRMIFATEKFHGPIVLRIRKGDLLFLNNIDADTIYGVFRAISNGAVNIQPSSFGGKYPYQVKVELVGSRLYLGKAKNVLKRFGIRRNTPIYRNSLADFLMSFLSKPKKLDATLDSQSDITYQHILSLVEKIKNSKAEVDIEEEIPLIETTTFWDFPKQSYGITPKGNNKYAGVTPALIIYNLVWRYTEPGELVVDPMCGSGTTIDVCKEEKRRVIGYDISSTRQDVIQNDARNIPLEDSSVDMVFVDSPYGDNIRYSDHPDDIGIISSESEEFFDELEKVMKECHRILKDGKILGWLIGDQWVKKKFTPVGLKIYGSLAKYFEPVDIVCVARRSQYSNTGVWHNRARRFNFYLRGFKYLIIVRKNTSKSVSSQARKIKWAHYDRPKYE